MKVGIQFSKQIILIKFITLNLIICSIPEQIKYLQELQKSVENNDINLSEDGEMENSLLLMQNTFQKLYEERLKLVSSSESRDNLTSLVQSIESSHHIRENEFEKHLKSFELICEKQENSEERKSLIQFVI